MVWIHGGNFIFGGASRYDGSAYENTVIVIIQYRLGLLGFFKKLQIFKCETSSSLSLINCLRNQEAMDIVFNSMEIPFLPLVLDGVFLNKSPEDILAGKEFNMVPFMIGVTNNEFGWNIRSVI
ncbi:carboxylesterase 1D-like [Phasianus colchicus]|uniref:carboxylesterase 1D-like n=1 Tax=Phasianus colchicus TaxID=9054 RepID=UPI00129D6D06|nr:carboxylesterase 1D-like [Phasianus colchicus]